MFIFASPELWLGLKQMRSTEAGSMGLRTGGGERVRRKPKER